MSILSLVSFQTRRLPSNQVSGIARRQERTRIGIAFAEPETNCNLEGTPVPTVTGSSLQRPLVVR